MATAEVYRAFGREGMRNQSDAGKREPSSPVDRPRTSVTETPVVECDGAQAPPFGTYANSFDPDTLKALGAAFDSAVASLHGPSDAAREAIADLIMTAALNGECDLHWLCQEGLRGIALPG